jgi:F-type H+-transporting ATPase subunit b
MEEAQAFYTTREFWVSLSFVIFVAAAGRPIWRALSGALDARAGRIKSEIEEAAKLREEAKTLLASYQRKQREAAKEVSELVAHAKSEAELASRKAAEELAAALQRREQMAMDRIAQAESQALQQVRNVAVDVATAATRRLMAEHLDARRAGALIDKASRAGEIPLERFPAVSRGCAPALAAGVLFYRGFVASAVWLPSQNGTFFVALQPQK